MPDNVDILLVHLPFYEPFSIHAPQLGMLYVASNLVASGFKVGVLDDPEITRESLVGYICEYRPQILGFHVTTDSLPRICRAISILKPRHINIPLIIFGGPHVTIEVDIFLKINLEK